MAALPRAPALVPLPNVTFDGKSFPEWSTMLRVCLNSQRLWGHLTGRPPCPHVLVRPEEPIAEVDGAPPSDEIKKAYTEANENYMLDLSDYEDWLAAEARAIDPIWQDEDQVCYRSFCSAFHFGNVGACVASLPAELVSSLQQQDSSVDVFYH